MLSDAEITAITGDITFADGRTSSFTLYPVDDENPRHGWTWQQGGMDAHLLAERAPGEILERFAAAVGESQQSTVSSDD